MIAYVWAQFAADVADLAKFVGGVAVIAGTIKAASRVKWVRWLGRRLISEPFGGWFRSQVSVATEPLQASADEAKATATVAAQRAAEIQHLVSYHLGTNDETKPWHERLADLEEANGLPRTPQMPKDRR